MASAHMHLRRKPRSTPITRRRFMSCLACTGVCSLLGAGLSSCRDGPAQVTGADASPTPYAQANATDAPAPGDVLPPFTRKASYATALEPKSGRSRVRCELCPRVCVVSEGDRGECGVRENRGGELYTVVYGRACSVHADPIEKKPLYHFLPGSQAFSLATAGCNLHCLYCQNWQISQRLPEELQSIELLPEAVVETARDNGCPVIAYTYSEPTVFYEYMLDTARLARESGLRSVVISAGYINPEPLRQLCQTVDAIKIDFKGYSRAFYQRICSGTLQPVLDALQLIQTEDVHLEIVTLVVPTLNDDAEHLQGLCSWVAQELGPDVPIHFSRFHPQYKLNELPMTPVETLEQARQIALNEGIHYAYIGNVPGHPGDNSYCHRCGELILRRQGFAVTEQHLADGKCEFCAQPIPGVWS